MYTNNPDIRKVYTLSEPGKIPLQVFKVDLESWFHTYPKPRYYTVFVN